MPFLSQYMKACEGVFASGDIAHFPLKMLNGEKVSIGHWQIAHKHGKFLFDIKSFPHVSVADCSHIVAGLTAARNMLGQKEEINTIPFFWTSQFGKSIRYCGRLF